METKFKPFDKVLVRDEEGDIWKSRLFDRISSDSHFPYICQDELRHKYCILFEGNERLHNTTNDYIEPFEPKDRDLVLTIEQCKHLQELGLDMSDAKLCYLYFESLQGNEYVRPYFCDDIREGDKIIYTYTLQDVLRHINKLIKKNEVVCYSNTLNSAYELLCELLERENKSLEKTYEPLYENGLIFDDMEDYTIIKHR